MSDNEMDDIIKKAAGEHHPPYDDKAWDKMEQLLDKHLPVKKDRSFRALYLLLLLLLLGTATYFGVSYFTGKADSGQTIVSNDQDKQNSKNTGEQKNNTTGNDLVNTNNAINSNPANNVNPTQPPNQLKAITKTKDDLVTKATTINPSSLTTSSGGKDPNRKTLRKKTNSRTTIVVSDNNPDIALEPNNKEVKPKDEKRNDEVVVNKVKEEDKLIKKDTIAAVDTTAKKTGESKEKKKHSGFADRLGITFSIGPDVSFVRAKDMGQISPDYGAGISYKLSNRLTIQSGFYVTNKIYNADSSDYYPPKEFWNYYKTLDEVFANCKVYEIPVLLTYNFKTVKKHNWFATTGLSSFLMKTETYTYYYTNPAGYYTNKTYTFTNQNKHYFAVLTLSGGYRYNINKRFTLDAAPYLKLPLAGVGYGKVKLNSAGALFTLTIKPFAK